MSTEKSIFEKSYSAQSNVIKAVEKEYGSNWSQIVEVFQFENKRWGVRPISMPESGDDLEIEVNSIDSLADEADVDGPVYAGHTHCPHCQIHLSNGVGHHGDEVNGTPVYHETNEWQCLACGGEFGNKISRAKDMSDALRAARQTYTQVLSYSNGISLDNGDQVATALRGMAPEQVCAVADLAKNKDNGFHAIKYANLNIGQRRMNAGNVIRGSIKSGERTIKEILQFVATVRQGA